MNKDNGRTELHLAETVQEAQKVLKNNGNLINKGDDNGVLPIHIAAAQRDPEYLKVLVEHKASLESTTKFGKTPLHYAAMADNVQNVEWIASNGVAMDCADKKLQSTPVILAAMLNNVPCTIALVKLGSKLDLVDRLGSNVLHYAVRNNQRELTSLLIQQGMSTDSKDIHGCTCLHYAAANGNAEIVRLLISARANLMALNREGHIPMHLAAAGGHTHVIKEFLSAKVPFGYTSPNNNSTALYYAALSGNEEIVKILVNLGSELFHQCNGSQTPLHAAASRGHLPSVKLLLELGSNLTMTDESGQIPLHKAARYGHQHCVEFLQRKAPHTVRYRDKHGHTPMAVAAIAKHKECMELLLQKESSSPKWADRDGRTALHWAACAGHATLLRELLKNNNVETMDLSGKTPLHWAVSCANEETVRVLLEHGASITAVCADDSCNAIQYAAMVGSTPILQMMFGARNVPEVNSSNDNGTPLFFACRGGHSSSAMFLIERGADVSYTGPGNNSVLHLAVKGGCSLESIKVLLKKGLVETATNEAGETPFHYAATLESTEILCHFLTAGKGKQVLNAKTKKNNTPLHYAVSFGNISVVEELVKAGADTSIKNHKGETPQDIAEGRNYTKCASALKKK